MTDQLYINDQLMDLSPGTRIGLTFQVNEIAELKDIKANTSNEFQIPRTKRNELALGYSNLVGSFTSLPYTKLSARLIQNGIEVIPAGIAIIEACSDVFKVQVLSGNYDFFKSLDQKRLVELTFPELDHVWGLTDIVAAIPNTVTQGYSYPVIDYTGSDTWFNHIQPGGVRLEKTYPGLFTKTIIKKIAQAQGYSCAGSFFDSTVIDHDFIPFAKERFNHSQRWVDLWKFKAIKTADQAQTTGGTMQHVEFESEIFDTSNTYTNFPGDGGRWYPVQEMKCGFQMTLHVEITAAGPIDFRTGFRYWNPLLGTFASAIYGFTQLNPGTYTIIIKTIPEDLAHVINGSYIIPMFFKSASGDTFIIKAGSTFENLPDPFMYTDTDVQMEAILPDMTQVDFIKSKCVQYAGVVDVDSISKTLRINLFNDLEKNKTNSRNWSGNLDVKTDPLINFRGGRYGQTNTFKYTEDENVPLGLGDGSFAIADELLPLTQALQDLPFAATEMTSILQAWYVPFIKVWNETGAAPPDPSGTEVAVKPRTLMHFVNNDPDGYLKYVDEAGFLLHQPFVAPMAWFIFVPGNPPPPPITTMLGFDDNLLDEFYRVLINMLSKFKKVTAYFKLTEVDVQNFDHMIPVYIEKFGEHFFVNKISNFKPGSLTQVELYRI